MLAASSPQRPYPHMRIRLVKRFMWSRRTELVADWSPSQSRYACLVVATSGAFSCIPPLLGWLSANLHNTAHVGVAIALNIAWGTPGQILGVWIYKKSEKQRGYPTGHWVNAGLLVFVAIACLSLRFYYRILNKGIRRQDGMASPFCY